MIPICKGLIYKKNSYHTLALPQPTSCYRWAQWQIYHDGFAF